MPTTHPNGSACVTLLIENSVTRVTRWDFGKRGDNTGWHRHAYDYVVVPLFNGKLEIIGVDGTRSDAPVQNGVAYFRPAGVEHDVINGNDFACSFIEIEFLATGSEA